MESSYQLVGGIPRSYCVNERSAAKLAVFQMPPIESDSAVKIDDIRIIATKELVAPRSLISRMPAAPVAATVHRAREAVHRILSGADSRLLAIVGPCSIHDRDAALEYAERLRAQAEKTARDLLVVMRVYFEKPRTTVGWKGLINDPHLDDSFEINEGLALARGILLEINRLGVPCGTEYLDVISPQYYADLISWGAIGARTTESQGHRELASGLSCPVGFKNGTDGNVKIAADAVRAASQPHHFLSVTKEGKSAISSTSGNEDCHIILRGGNGKPNYDSDSVENAVQELAKSGLPGKLMIDCSHANSEKDYRNQPKVCADIAKQIEGGDTRIIGVMIESNLVEGRQDIEPGRELIYGQSITDSCVGWEATTEMLAELAAAVKARQNLLEQKD